MSEKEKRPARILVADWIPQFCNIYGRLLREAGFEVVTAGNEEEVLAVLSFERFDVVFLDVRFQNLVGCFGRKNAGVPIVGLDHREEQWSATGVDAVLDKRDAIGQCVETAKAVISEKKKPPG